MTIGVLDVPVAIAEIHALKFRYHSDNLQLLTATAWVDELTSLWRRYTI